MSGFSLLALVLVLPLAHNRPPLAQAARPSTQSGLSEIPKAVREEIDRLASDDAGKRATAAVSLGKMGAAAIPAIPYLIGALGDSRSVVGPLGRFNVAELALQALTELGEPARQSLLSALKTKSAKEPDRVMWALGMMKEARAVDLILPYLGSDLSPWAVEALGDLGDRRSVEPLIAQLTTAKGHAAEGIAQALGKLGDSRAIEPLIPLLMEDRPYPSDVANALEKLTGQKFKSRKEAAAWWQANKDKLKPH